MQPSKSQYIGWESIPLKELFKRDPGSVALYIPAQDDDGKVQGSIARISSAAKRWASHNRKRCVINTLLVLKQDQESDLPTPSKMVQVVVSSADDLSPVGKRYIEANPR